jgi:hypothetical protein
MKEVKRNIKYTIFFLPVASTFTHHQRRKAEGVEKNKRIYLKITPLLGLGITEPLLVVFVNHDINNTVD